jgi:GT2 family glycosyltransferase
MNCNFTMLVHNRPVLTRQALESIMELSDISVAILAHRCDDQTSIVIEDWFTDAVESSYQIHVKFSDDEMGTGPARNAVVSSSEAAFGRGKYLYLSDNDVKFIGSDWLSTLQTAYEEAWEQGYRVLGAYNHPYHLPVSTIKTKTGHTVNEVYALASQSMLMRWEVWDEYGPMCTTPAGKVCQSEDVDFSNRIRADGFKVGVISPPLLVNTGITNSFGEKIPGWEAVIAEAPLGVIIE